MARPSWLTLNKLGGSGNDTVTYTATENTGRNQRTGIVTYIAAGVSSIQQTVTQAGKTEFVSFNSASYSVTNAGGNLTISGTSNSKLLTFAISSGEQLFTVPIKYVAAGAEINHDGATEIPGDPGASGAYIFEVTVTIPTNATTVTKDCTFTALCKDTSKYTSCTVSQSGVAAALSISPNSISFIAAGESKTTTVTSNTTWDIS